MYTNIYLYRNISIDKNFSLIFNLFKPEFFLKTKKMFYWNKIDISKSTNEKYIYFLWNKNIFNVYLEHRETLYSSFLSLQIHKWTLHLWQVGSSLTPSSFLYIYILIYFKCVIYLVVLNFWKWTLFTSFLSSSRAIWLRSFDVTYLTMGYSTLKH